MTSSASALAVAAVTVAIGFATSVAAKEPRQIRAVPQSPYNNNPTCVYRSGRPLGCDPDPNIRMMLERTNGNHAGPA
jgi:hypothetical protein